MTGSPWLVPMLLATGMTTAAIAPRGDPERQAVLATIHRLFDGMRNGDSAAVRAAFHPSAYLATALQSPTGPVLRVDTLEAFVRAVGSPHDEEVRIDGPLATVWTEYSFFAGARFSHCGVDAFQLARTGEGWRIIALTDTRRREGCRDGGGG
jgi:Putative lumazine-binding